MGDIAIGIDLGTTNSCVACYKNNEVEVIENVEGRPLTPSCVYFFKDEEYPVVGDAAKKMSVVLPSNGIYEIKRFMGKRYNEIKDRLKYFSFNVTKDGNDYPVIEIVHKNEVIKKKTPQEISALILTKLKKDAEQKLKQEIDKAVITVPAYFSSAQRAATMTAAEQAGFNVLQLLNEPTAAALSYYFSGDNKTKGEGYSLVYDLGGGTFDVSILRGSSNNIDVIGVDGDTSLGGKDFDNFIIDYVCEKLQNDYDYDAKSDRREMRRLQNICEQAKIELSSAEITTIVLEGFLPNNPTISIEISREAFEGKANNLFKRTIDIVSRSIEKCKITKEQINEVILAGGSSRIPKIQKLLQDFFNGKSLNKTLHIDQCVAEGAAIRAAMLCSSPMQEIRTLKMTDVVPLSIGVEGLANQMSFVIRRNSTLPASGTKKMVTVLDQQEAVCFRLYEGERLDARKNFYLGSLELENITKAAPGQRTLVVTLTMDTSGILHMKAEEESCDNVKEININYNRKALGEISSAIVNAEENKIEDLKFAEFANLKSYLIKYCQAILSNLRIQKLEEQYGEIAGWCLMTTMQTVLLEIEDQAKIEDLIEKTKEKCEPLVSKHNFEKMPEFIPSFLSLLLFGL